MNQDTGPTLRTPRLLLRPFHVSDAGDVQRLAGDAAVADTTLRIPHPYPDGLAQQWIWQLWGRFQAGQCVAFAVIDAGENTFVGSISLEIERACDRAELGYWIGKPFWNRGYCTEAARAVLAYGFRELALHRIFAHHFRRNPASGRVMEKVGMVREGLARGHVKKGERYEDLVYYGILRQDLHPAA
jgi:[ribosomal protein S5]-alanine N-acetyltransferase